MIRLVLVCCEEVPQCTIFFYFPRPAATSIPIWTETSASITFYWMQQSWRSTETSLFPALKPVFCVRSASSLQKSNSIEYTVWIIIWKYEGQTKPERKFSPLTFRQPKDRQIDIKASGEVGLLEWRGWNYLHGPDSNRRRSRRVSLRHNRGEAVGRAGHAWWRWAWNHFVERRWAGNTQYGQSIPLFGRQQ